MHQQVFESPPDGPPARPIGNALARGMASKCPSCGTGALFDGYLTVKDHCGTCNEALHHHRADDAPPYFTIFIVGHIIVGLILAVEKLWGPPIWLQMAVWLPLTALLSLALLRPVKGAVVGLQWALFMHGFDPNHTPEFGED